MSGTPHAGAEPRPTLANGPGSWAVDLAGDPRNPAPETVLAAVAEAGYRWTELGPLGYLPADAQAVRATLTAHGLGAVGSFLMEPLDGDPRELEALARAVAHWSAAAGARVLVVLDAGDAQRRRTAGRSADAVRLDAGARARLHEGARCVARAAREVGLVPVFHPHAGTRVEFDDELDALLEAVPELDWCLDPGHVLYAGGDPLAQLARHGERLGHVHLKDVDADVLRTVHAERASFEQAVARRVFVPLGAGAVDFAALRDALAAVAYDGFALVEQDVAPDALEHAARDARSSRAFAERIGLTTSGASALPSPLPTLTGGSPGG